MPSFMNNQTLGGKFLNIKFEFKINNFFGLLLKEITIILYYQFIPSILASGISYLSKINLNHVYLGLIIIVYFLTLFFIFGPGQYLLIYLGLCNSEIFSINQRANEIDSLV